ncbi:transmembrane GTPase Marf-like [Artemia franciscana]
MSTLARTLSIQSGNIPQALSVSNGLGADHLTTSRTLSNTASPLQIFVRAKKKINDIFADIESYSEESFYFLEELPKNLANKGTVEEIGTYVKKLQAIRYVLSRDHMKCVFFGRTSNGKSSVINAMLREKILPSGIGHTTNCFLQVEGSENGDSYLITEDSDEKQNVKSVAQLAHALCTEKIGCSALMRVVWPKDKCPLLRDDVVFVDSPGIDVSPNLDEWIDKHCVDADVFVLVANAESTLMLTEKNFFHKVSSRLSKPNIFILNNRWDASANEPEYLEEVKKQHLQRSVDFLVNELKVISSKEEAENRVFFVSAKEVLQARLNEQKKVPIHSGIAMTEGFFGRLHEFENFEKQFEECISRSAVRTKFDHHTSRGKLIVSNIRMCMENIRETSLKKSEELQGQKVELSRAIEETERQMLLVTKEAKNRIRNMVEEVEIKVSKALSEEIRRLSALVEEFSEPFDSNLLVLNEYKKKLHKHVDYGLVTSLRSRLTSAVSMNIDSARKEMAAQIVNILPDSKKSTVQLPLDNRPFEVNYPFRCDNLCADFKEDIEFKFSFGVLTVVHRLAGNKLGYFSRLRNQNVEASQSTAITPMTPVIQTQSLMGTEEWSVISKFALATVSSQGAVGGLVIGGFLMKTIGWRLILGFGVIYSGSYLYQWLTWTNKSKEKTFKKQYVQHVTRQLRLVVDLISSNCSHQVQQELSSTFARLGSFVDNASVDMQDLLREVEKDIEVYESISNEAKKLRNKANFINSELQQFEEMFLQAS